MSDWRGLKMEEFELKLTEAEMQTVFNALLERPFKEVFALIQKIQELYNGEKNGSTDV